MSEIQISKYSVIVLEFLFTSLRDASYDQMFDASVYLYNYVSKEGIYPAKIVDGFYSAMSILSELTTDQFWQVKSIYS